MPTQNENNVCSQEINQAKFNQITQTCIAMIEMQNVEMRYEQHSKYLQHHKFTWDKPHQFGISNSIKFYTKAKN